MQKQKNLHLWLAFAWLYLPYKIFFIIHFYFLNLNPDVTLVPKHIK